MLISFVLLSLCSFVVSFLTSSFLLALLGGRVIRSALAVSCQLCCFYYYCLVGSRTDTGWRRGKGSMGDLSRGGWLHWTSAPAVVSCLLSLSLSIFGCFLSCVSLCLLAELFYIAASLRLEFFFSLRGLLGEFGMFSIHILTVPCANVSFVSRYLSFYLFLLTINKRERKEGEKKGEDKREA
ncbi:unnamed protein product [Trypanosoma congolense IL3000]|uniref:WGS project CAEQ00000000 data, annotated contig 1450 n=1 Tax=Trypanosoma congolense (strain IL3000) TaxID=1068625 RepID=F9W6D6_TRYCI|nr:unnamed protein product [Trypanosoma congolense IL3000]